MPVVYQYNRKDPTTQRIKLVVWLLFLLPGLAAVYYFTADYLFFHRRQKPTEGREVKLRVSQAAYDANARLLEVSGMLEQFDVDAKGFFGSTHEWPEGQVQTHPAIVNWVHDSGSTEPLQAYHDLDSRRLALLEKLEELTTQVDQAGSGSNASVASELQTERLYEGALVQAIDDASALAASLNELGTEYLAFQETH